MTTVRTWLLPAAVLLAMLVSTASAADPIEGASPEQLRRWLKQYSQADANGDGTLSIDEARAYYRKLQARREPQPPGFRHEYAFAAMSDGVKIALAVGYPQGFDPADAGRKWPAIFITCGYAGCVTPEDPAEYGQRFVTVSASLRGSGASGGELCPWRERTWQDGYEVLENWIVRQPWSNGRVGIHGFSWPGLMGFMTATTQPPSLRAVCVGGLIDDFYRGISYVGGVRNPGFPVDWLNQYYQPEGPFGSGEAARQARGLSDDEYAKIVQGRPTRDLTRDILWLLLHQPLDCPQWHEQGLGTYASRIRAPILIGHAWQDEQTGPTGWKLWKRVPDDVPKRLVLTNGSHHVQPLQPADLKAWFGHWLLGEQDASVLDPNRRVACYFETRSDAPSDHGTRGEPLTARDFPLPDTQWTRLFLRSGGKLSPTLPGKDERGSVYTVGHGLRRGDDSRVTFVQEFTEPTAICGPGVLTLWATLSTIDTDFYVLLADQAPDGSLYGLQRGLLRASHREVDEAKSVYVDSGGRRILVEPFHPHCRVEPVPPREPVQYQIEIHAVGHVLRPGHKLLATITRPPESDPIGATRSGAPSYRYDSMPPPGKVVVLHDADHPSSILLPTLPKLPPLPDKPVPMNEQAGILPVR